MINRDELTQIRDKGLSKQNSSLVQILGLCPLLAVPTNVVNGVMLSVATIIVMAVANVAVASLRNLIPHEIGIPVFILIAWKNWVEALAAARHSGQRPLRAPPTAVTDSA